MYRNVELIKKSIYGRPGDVITLSEQVAIRYVRDGLGKDVGAYEMEAPIKIVRTDGTVEMNKEVAALETPEETPEEKAGAGADAELKNKGARETTHK